MTEDFIHVESLRFVYFYCFQQVLKTVEEPLTAWSQMTGKKYQTLSELFKLYAISKQVGKVAKSTRELLVVCSRCLVLQLSCFVKLKQAFTVKCLSGH
jgi:hypothetical protein